jgi:protein TonB
MSYVDQPISRGRVWSIAIVAILHALLAYAFVSGLAYRFIKGTTPDMKTFDVKEEPPPPPEEPPPPPPDQPSSPPMTVVQPIVQIPNPAPVQQVQPIQPQQPIQPRVEPRVEPQPVQPVVRTVPPQRARANLNSYFSADDYPAAALRGEDQGTTSFRLTIGPNGRVTDCAVTGSSGSSALDQATCRILRSRARYTPARDGSGNPSSGTDSGRVTWRLPAE